MLENRTDTRHSIGFRAEIVSRGRSCAGIVENVSANGLYARAYPSNEAIDFNPGAELDIKCQFSSGEIVYVTCEVQWSRKSQRDGLAFSIGTKIMDSSLEYNNFLKSLSLNTRKPRVIIFDDEKVFLYSLKRWLSQKEYEVLTFDNPLFCQNFDKGTNHCMKENPCADIMITDFSMPEMNGVELLQYQSQRGCKIDKRHKAIVSGYIDDHNKKLINESDYSFFKKPLDLTSVSDWLSVCSKSIDLSLPLDSL